MAKSIVFIHGIGLGKWMFEEYFVPWYESQGYEVHALDLPGHSPQSTASERQGITLDICVQYVADYLSQNVHSPFVLVGMSMGGAICQRLLAGGFADPNLRGVVLLSSVPPCHNLTFSLRLFRRLAQSNSEVLIDFFTDKVNSKLMFAPETLSSLSEQQIQGYLDRIVKSFPMLEFEIFFKDLLSKPFTPPCPMKIIGGEDDLLFTPDVIEFTASYYSKKAEILPGLGHLIPFETNYQRGIDAIDRFLTEVI
ncbi:alpha/beta hydrolase [Paraneptunicella aestuarii]|uniref:alpha/beta hydrolase n=1 Tax=Paraneptunicella aestuarii TaxID=2831148 RepID=UPI001E529120|nr:alpha/beta hydrolase [Paraneptunicella aestuarii]UAA37457.1 alpha/beta hydrolase [Paraneptunicella aestuarii]